MIYQNLWKSLNVYMEKLNNISSNKTLAPHKKNMQAQLKLLVYMIGAQVTSQSEGSFHRVKINVATASRYRCLNLFIGTVYIAFFWSSVLSVYRHCFPSKQTIVNKRPTARCLCFVWLASWAQHRVGRIFSGPRGLIPCK